MAARILNGPLIACGGGSRILRSEWDEGCLRTGGSSYILTCADVSLKSS
jgi:hypothetical protein